MMRKRLGLLGVFAALTASFAIFTSVGAAPAAAQGSGGLTTPIPCTIGGVASTCNLTITSLQLVNGVLQAAGNVTGGGVTIPFSGVPLLVTSGGSCQILDLTLGPLHLDLLGLVVDLNQVHLNITAQQGPGNLLGNLLCSVAHLLDSSGSPTALNQLTNLLNQILAGL